MARFFGSSTKKADETSNLSTCSRANCYQKAEEVRDRTVWLGQAEYASATTTAGRNTTPTQITPKDSVQSS